MSYGLEFLEVALDEWRSLDATLKRQLQKKLRSRLENPVVPSAALRGMAHYYKIKLRASGIRLVYQVIEERLVVLVVSVGSTYSTTLPVNRYGRYSQLSRSICLSEPSPHTPAQELG
ncbi:type II toxin-antitoxin system RelE/ParE family toxin [Sedimenticola hydrogenitrophicus]|uniref:type II toxin-antitoxin system RelE family toxin n=1 Tax=Sedimenticola hydrogenitrophicus TaxID=2967975 RepID=UPI002FF5E273